MAEENTPTSATPQAGDAGNAPTPQAGNTTTTEPQAGESQSEPLSLDEARKLRSEASNLRTRLKAAEAKAAEFDKLKADAEAAKLSETERLQKQLADLQKAHETATAQVKAERARAAIQVQAFQNGIDPKLAARLIELSDLEYDDDGQPSNVPALIKTLIKEYPNLVSKAAPATSGGATNPARSQSSTEPITREYVASLKPADYAAMSVERRAEISKWIASGGMQTRRR